MQTKNVPPASIPNLGKKWITSNVLFLSDTPWLKSTCFNAPLVFATAYVPLFMVEKSTDDLCFFFWQCKNWYVTSYMGNNPRFVVTSCTKQQDLQVEEVEEWLIRLHDQQKTSFHVNWLNHLRTHVRLFLRTSEYVSTTMLKAVGICVLLKRLWPAFLFQGACGSSNSKVKVFWFPWLRTTDAAKMLNDK